VFERFQNMTDAPLKRCPECRGKVARLFGTGAGVIFKGSGFYETDYKRGDRYKSEAKQESGKETAAAKDTKSDAGGKSAGSGAAAKTESKAGKATAQA
jgi:putative FmdB family regulatory protein